MIKNRINLVIIILLTTFIVFYSLDIKKKYPKWVIVSFNEPIVRFLLYLLAYALTLYNPLIAFVFLIIIISLHLDYNRLCQTSFLL